MLALAAAAAYLDDLLIAHFVISPEAVALPILAVHLDVIEVLGSVVPVQTHLQI